MRGYRHSPLLLFLLLFALAPRARAQGSDVFWRIDPSVKSCSMAIDPSLTQAQWKTFVEQAGAIVDFKSLGSAEPIGKGRVRLGIDYTVSPIHQRDPAWINTFVHPDENCPLGDQIHMPRLRAQLGVSERMDLTGFWTTAPNANYGLAGGALKYAFLMESARAPAAAVDLAYTGLTGVADFNFNLVSVGVSASKRAAGLTPYLGVRHSLAVGNETTSKVDLKTETVPLTHGYAGVSAGLWKLALTTEYDVASVRTFALQVGVRP